MVKQKKINNERVNDMHKQGTCTLHPSPLPPRLTYCSQNEYYITETSVQNEENNYT